MTKSPVDFDSEICPTGVPGLDEIVRGGLPKNQIYLLQGLPGTGKTTLSMQFLLEGAKRGERSLYITFSETKRELEAVAEAHGWDLSKIEILELSAISESMKMSSQSTLFHPSEIELSKVIQMLMEKIKSVSPDRIVFDSISEVRLLAESSLRYRRQMLAFKEFFVGRGPTVLFLDDMTTEEGDLHVRSIVHGVLLLEKFRASYGVERREFHIDKLRGVNFRGGTHDYVIEPGGMRIFPRLVSSQHKAGGFTRQSFTSGIDGLDSLVGGGLDSGTSNLILGPAGSGKSTIALRYALTAAKQGKRVSLFSFEESIETLVHRAVALEMDLKPMIESGNIKLRKIDPAELTPGQFASLVRSAVDDDVDMVVIDSLNGYVHAMPEQKFLMLQLHELLTYLGSRGIVTIMVLAQAGIMGSMQSPLDLTYLADTVILTRYFEAFGKIKKAISIIKRRTGSHEDSLREMRIGPGGVLVGKVLDEFSGVFSGIPKYLGEEAKMMKVPE
ncbi:MAG: ATPase domain-containing protein [Bdellovibrionota bacterium]